MDIAKEKHIPDLNISGSIGGEAVNGGAVWTMGGGLYYNSDNHIVREPDYTPSFRGEFYIMSLENSNGCPDR